MKVMGVERDSVCGGILVKPKLMMSRVEKIIEINPYTRKNKLETYNIEYYSNVALRQILFSKDNDGLAIDVAFESPRYQIGDNNVKAPHCNNFSIQSYSELGKLLKYLNYEEIVTPAQLKNLMRKIASNRWFFKNLHLFGYEKIGDSLMHDSKLEIFPYSMYETIRDMHQVKKYKPFSGEPGNIIK